VIVKKKYFNIFYVKGFRGFFCSIYIEQYRMISPIKSPQKYGCCLCYYNTCNIKDYKKHILTLKHQNRTFLNKIEQEIPKNPQTMLKCECGKEYSARNSLWYHKKTCAAVKGSPENDDKKNNNTNHIEIDKELMIKILLKNQDVMEKMIEVMPQIGNQIHTNSHNTTNNQFNIQMFLNEHCKNAMNLTDFIDSLPITSETYDSTIENGLTKTITNMLVNGLSQLDILDRPIHCTDATRKILYVKDDNTWVKDNERLHIIKCIKTLSMKQRTMLNKWQDANMGWDTKENLQSRMTRLVFNSMTSIEKDDKETGKIIRAISKNVYLDTDTKKQYIQHE